MLISIYQTIAEKEGTKDSFSINNLLKLLTRADPQVLEDLQYRNIKSQFETVVTCARNVDITYPPFQNVVPELENYIWKIEVRLTFLKNKGKAREPFYKLLRTLPDNVNSEDLVRIQKALSLETIEDTKLIRKSISEWLNDKDQTQNIKKLIFSALVSKINDPESVNLIRLANKIIHMNEGKLTESFAH